MRTYLCFPEVALITSAALGVMYGTRGGVVIRGSLTMEFIRIRRRLDLTVRTQNIDVCYRRESSVPVETSGIGRRASEEGGQQKVLHPCVRDGY